MFSGANLYRVSGCDNDFHAFCSGAFVTAEHSTRCPVCASRMRVLRFYPAKDW
jgi:hypothetical protein